MSSKEEVDRIYTPVLRLGGVLTDKDSVLILPSPKKKRPAALEKFQDPSLPAYTNILFVTLQMRQSFHNNTITDVVFASMSWSPTAHTTAVNQAVECKVTSGQRRIAVAYLVMRDVCNPDGSLCLSADALMFKSLHEKFRLIQSLEPSGKHAKRVADIRAPGNLEHLIRNGSRETALLDAVRTMLGRIHLPSNGVTTTQSHRGPMRQIQVERSPDTMPAKHLDLTGHVRRERSLSRSSPTGHGVKRRLAFTSELDETRRRKRSRIA